MLSLIVLIIIIVICVIFYYKYKDKNCENNSDLLKEYFNKEKDVNDKIKINESTVSYNELRLADVNNKIKDLETKNIDLIDDINSYVFKVNDQSRFLSDLSNLLDPSNENNNIDPNIKKIDEEINIIKQNNTEYIERNETINKEIQTINEDINNINDRIDSNIYNNKTLTNSVNVLDNKLKNIEMKYYSSKPNIDIQSIFSLDEKSLNNTDNILKYRRFKFKDGISIPRFFTYIIDPNNPSNIKLYYDYQYSDIYTKIKDIYIQSFEIIYGYMYYKKPIFTDYTSSNLPIYINGNNLSNGVSLLDINFKTFTIYNKVEKYTIDINRLFIYIIYN